MSSSEDDYVSDEEQPWAEEHHEVLAELFTLFKDSGRRVFGGAFFQHGTFADFVLLIHKHSF
jgi:hypothetical protein